MRTKDDFEFCEKDVLGTLHGRFERVVRQFPEVAALQFGSETVTYGELNRRANQIASVLTNSGTKRPEPRPVALICDRSPNALAALLGVLKTGDFYTSISSALPVDSMALHLRSAEPRAIVADAEHVKLAHRLAGGNCPVFELDELLVSGRESDWAPTTKTDSLQRRPAGIYYTSGSTGRPKGVVRGHHTLLHQVLSCERIAQTHVGDRRTFGSNLAYVSSTSDLFVALLNGATLAFVDFRSTAGATLFNWLLTENITCLKLPIALFRTFVDFIEPGMTLPNLRQIDLGGDKLYVTDLLRFWDKCPSDPLITHSFSASETAISAVHGWRRTDTFYGDVVPAGPPVRGKEILILDENGTHVRDGDIGEIVVRSPYLSMGYWRNIELTREKFVQSGDSTNVSAYFTGDLGRLDNNGMLEHIGRKDSVVKIRGLQVVIPEVEATLWKLASIANAVVVVHNADFGNPSDDRRLIAYLVPTIWPPPNNSVLIRELSKLLAPPMMPSVFVWMDEFPLVENGKVDRAKLPSPPGTRPRLDVPFWAPRTPIEKMIAVIWCQVLQLDIVGVQDPFLDLGGNSLSATRVVSRIGTELGIQENIVALYGAATIEQMAKTVLTELLAVEERAVTDEVDI